MASFRYLLLTILCLGVTNLAYSDLFREVELIERPPYSEFETWHVIYRNRTNLSYGVHIHVDNPSCSVDGIGVIVQVQDSDNKPVAQESVPGFQARLRSLRVPAGGLIRVKFLGNTQDGTSFDNCRNAYPKAYYQLSEPLPN